MLEMISPAALPKNVNGFRTTHTCELCGFEPKTKNKYREKQDHLVMKHFKEKIDKIFPHCRPYSCPSPECSFTGKDKQALLRHYTGKHGILERYLREALAEKGIEYIPGDHGSKRKHSTDHNGTPKAKKMALSSQTTLIDAKDMLPKSPIPIQHQNQNGGAQTGNINNGNGTTIFRPNSEELRKEVEAMMASFQPQPQQEVVTVTTANGTLNGSSVKVTLPSLPTAPVPVSLVTAGTQQTSVPVTMAANGHHIVDDNKKTVILSSKLPNVTLQSQPPSSVVSLIKRSNEPAVNQQQIQVNGKPTTLIMTTNGHMNNRTVTNGHQTVTNGHQTIHIPELILPDQMQNGLHAIPIEVITAAVPDTNGTITVATGNGTQQVIENEEVMWGAGTLGPAVVVESADTIPVTYIEASEIVYNANLDNIDYDYMLPVTTGTTTTGVTMSTTEQVVRNVRERQLDFNML